MHSPKKAKNLPRYHSPYSEIDLLLVADRTYNSGRLEGIDGLKVENRGFRAIYFMSYLESIHRVG